MKNVSRNIKHYLQGLKYAGKQNKDFVGEDPVKKLQIRPQQVLNKKTKTPSDIAQKHLIPFLILIFVGYPVFSQTKVGGEVIDPDGEPMAFTNVIFANSTEGTTTNEDGKFYMESNKNYNALKISFTGYKTVTFPIKSSKTLDIEVEMKENTEKLGAVQIYSGKTPKKNNPAIDILKKIWQNRRRNGIYQYDQYQYDKYEKLEFDLNSIDSAMINSKLFKNIQFIFDKIDTSALSGKNYLPIFINEAVFQVYGDNTTDKEREILEGNKNSGFNNNYALVDFIGDLYADYNVYDNYLKFFNKSFISPLSKTGIDVYNYVLADSAYRENKWSYKIVYYPRRKNELTFKGDFWVNDTTWAITDINLEMSKKANINWVNDVYMEQEFEAINDSTFVLKRDHFMANFALRKKEDAHGIYGKRTTLYHDYKFNEEKPKEFYEEKRGNFDKNVYNRSDKFWHNQRVKNLTPQELGTYAMLDSLKHTKTFKHLYNLGSIIGSGYVNFGDFDFGPLPTLLGYNDVEGLRLRLSGRTFFSPNDMWRLEGFAAYGFKDHKIKYGLSGKWLLDPQSRLKIMAGYRKDIEQLGASLTNTADILGRNLASSSLFTIGSNKSLTNIKMADLGVEVSPFKNFKIRMEGNYRELSPASPEFSLDYFKNQSRTETVSTLKQSELSATVEYFPNRKVANHGVERQIINKRHYGHVFLKYTRGIKGMLDSGFSYNKLQLYYRQPLYIGGFGLFTPIIEAGKTFGKVPLGLLSVIPGNQSIFSINDAFPLLDYYEFVTDTYVSGHLEHNFGGRLFSYIPFLRDLNLREIVGIRGVYGALSDENRALNASTSHPYLRAPDHHLYWGWSVGVGNIFNVLQIDLHFRGNYRNPGTRKFGLTGKIHFNF